MIEITIQIIESFREDKPAFSDEAKWPDDFINSALIEADVETGGAGWGGFENIGHNFKRRGMFLYAAHWLSSNYNDAGASLNPSSDARLNVQSKSVGDESVSYRVPSMMGVGDDWLTYTNYGTQFYRLRRRAAMGASTV
jgi:hypothetical protein